MLRRAGALLLLALVAGAGCGGGPPSDHFEQRSRAVGRTLEHRVLVPEGAGEKPPLLVLLHGRSEEGPEGMVSDALVDALDAAGDRAPIVLLPDGGEASYWHNRRDGAWARMVVREAIPAAIERYGADPERVAIGGISMGGFGALHIAAAFPDRFCAVGAHSPAIFPDAASTAEGAFDDAEDFARHDVVAAARAEGRAPWGDAELWLDGGDEDPFRVADQALADALGIPLHVWSGGHDGDYWHRHYGAYLRFYARALAHC